MSTLVSLAPVEQFKQTQLANYEKACAQLDHQAFIDTIREISSENNFYITTFLRLHIPELNDPTFPLAVATTGSDGRLEKCSPVSPVELILITPNGRHVAQEIAPTIAKIENLVRTTPSLFDPIIESKQLDTDAITSLTLKVTKLIPCRAFDAQILAGNIDTFQDYKKCFHAELHVKPLRKFKHAFVAPSLKILSNECNPQQTKQALAINVQEGTLTTDGNSCKGPKYGLLRSIQYSVDHLFFHLIKSKKITQSDSIPSSIIDRINWLRDRTLINLSPEECESLKIHYVTGLRLYNQLEIEAARTPPSPDRPVIIQTDLQLLQTTLQETYSLVRKLLAPIDGK